MTKICQTYLSESNWINNGDDYCSHSCFNQKLYHSDDSLDFMRCDDAVIDSSWGNLNNPKQSKAKQNNKTKNKAQCTSNTM